MARRVRSAAISLLGVLLAGLSGCAAAPDRGGVEFVSAGFSASHLASEQLAVLPVGTIDLPEETPAAIDRDSLAAELARFAGSTLAAAVAETGVAGRTAAPSAIAPVLDAAGSVLLERLYSALARARPAPAGGGQLDPAAERDLETLRELLGTRYLLVPRSLELGIGELLRAEAILTLDLVDAGAGRIAWQRAVRAQDELPPVGDGSDLFTRALRDAVVAVAERSAAQLAAAGEEEPSGSATP